MTGIRVALSLCICWVALSVVGPQTASAAGTTSVTCKPVTRSLFTGGFKDAHCKEAESFLADYKHFSIENGKTTETTVTNAESCNNTGSTCIYVLHWISVGISLEISANVLHGTGSTVNSVNGSGEHLVSGGVNFGFSEVSVLKPEGKGCKVKGGAFETKNLATTTEGQEMAIRFAPESGTTIGSFEFEGCSGSKALEALNKKFEITGSVKGTPDGATTKFTSADTTAQGTFRVDGALAGIDGTFTKRGRVSGSEAYTPLSYTTTP